MSDTNLSSPPFLAATSPPPVPHSNSQQKDPSVEAALSQNNNEIRAKELGIRAKTALIAELKCEQREIQEAAARFSIYLKRISITPYNDATLEYLEHLIREERDKVGYGGGREKLEALERDREQYAAFVAAMTASIDGESDGMGKGNGAGAGTWKMLDEEGVYAVVDGLYKLKHSGADLRVSSPIRFAPALSIPLALFLSPSAYRSLTASPTESRQSSRISLRIHIPRETLPCPRTELLDEP